MAQVCNLPSFSGAAGAGLCLHPPGCCPEGAPCSTSRAFQLSATVPAKASPAPQERQTTLRPLTIVYGDRACTVEVTEAQALEILSTARRGLQQSVTSDASGGGDNSESGDGRRPAVTAADPGTAVDTGDYPRSGFLGQSMKGSLRRFLEKRAERSGNAAGLPYAAAAKTHSSPGVTLPRL